MTNYSLEDNKVFVGWPKIPRWENEKWTYTEKIDGTNACVAIHNDGTYHCQSRSRIITPENDNFGFATWVSNNESEVLKLGPGYHYGEWAGLGIQRGYDAKEKTFFLFDQLRWKKEELLPTNVVRLVPGFGGSETPERTLEDFIEHGSSLAYPGYNRPEGLIMRSSLDRGRLYKLIIDK